MPSPACSGWPDGVRYRRHRRSGRFGEFHRNPNGGDALQRRAHDVRGLDRVDFKVETDYRVGVIVLRFADQRLDRLQTFSFDRGGVNGAPTGGRLDTTDRSMAAAA